MVGAIHPRRRFCQRKMTLATFDEPGTSELDAPAHARWFDLIREFSTHSDQVVIENTGIVGRHAGDGLAAFFLAEQVGSRSAACAAALHAAEHGLLSGAAAADVVVAVRSTPP